MLNIESVEMDLRSSFFQLTSLVLKDISNRLAKAGELLQQILLRALGHMMIAHRHALIHRHARTFSTRKMIIAYCTADAQSREGPLYMGSLA